MKVTEIQELNGKFQKNAVQLSELIPSSALVQATSQVIRSVRKIDEKFIKLLSASTEMKFYQIIDQLENETDEIFFILDQMEMVNKKQKIRLIDDFLKEGYDLISIYSQCFDSVISKRIAEEE